MVLPVPKLAMRGLSADRSVHSTAGFPLSVLHQYPRFGVGPAMITLKMRYGTIPRERIVEWTSLRVHVGPPCEIAGMTFGRFCGSILAKSNYAQQQHSNEALREQTKPKLILRLAKAGKRDAATKLEQTIADAKARERLELKIRKRDFSE